MPRIVRNPPQTTRVCPKRHVVSKYDFDRHLKICHEKSGSCQKCGDTFGFLSTHAWQRDGSTAPIAPAFSHSKVCSSWSSNPATISKSSSTFLHTIASCRLPKLQDAPSEILQMFGTEALDLPQLSSLPHWIEHVDRDTVAMELLSAFQTAKEKVSTAE